MTIDLSKRINIGKGCAYTGISREQELEFGAGKKKRKFLVIVYGAYCAFGLYGSEDNGIAVLDVDKKQVLADQIAIESSGFYGPSSAQTRRFLEITLMDWEAFRAFVNSCGRNRYEI